MRIPTPTLLLAILAAAALAAAGCGSQRADAARDVVVNVRLVALDPVSQTPVIVLEEQQGERRLPIWIGLAEARSIAERLEELDAPRPNAHDLAKRLVEGLDGAIERVTVTELRDGTYYAVIALRARGRLVEIDSRPSDAIAIALRMAAPVFVREPLFESAGGLEPPHAEPPGRHTRAPARVPAAGIAPATLRSERADPPRFWTGRDDAVARSG